MTREGEVLQPSLCCRSPSINARMALLPEKPTRQPASRHRCEKRMMMTMMTMVLMRKSRGRSHFLTHSAVGDEEVAFFLVPLLSTSRAPTTSVSLDERRGKDRRGGGWYRRWTLALGFVEGRGRATASTDAFPYSSGGVPNHTLCRVGARRRFLSATTELRLPVAKSSCVFVCFCVCMCACF